MPINSKVSDNVPWVDYKPKIDLNPFYRTMDIFNGVFKKKVKFEKGLINSTDLKTIWVNLNETSLQPIASVEQPSDGLYHYTLKCGHPWSSKSIYAVDKYIPCWTCSGSQAYLVLEHEWDHIIFKSSPAARTMFIERYVAQLMEQSPKLNKERLTTFLHHLINAFDDIRVNSLQEQVYPGSAQRIWQRWQRLLSEREEDYNQTFLGFVLAIGVSLDVDQNGPFYQLRQIIEWGMAKARYRGHNSMLLSIRIVLDQCIKVLLAHLPPDQPEQAQGSEQHGEVDQKDQSTVGIPNAEKGGEEAGSSGGSPQCDNHDGSGDSNSPQRGSNSSPGTGQSGSQIQTPDTQRTKALSLLIDGAASLDEKETHPAPTIDEAGVDQNSVANRLAIINIFNRDVDDLIQKAEQDMPANQPDEDMQQIIDLLKNSIPQKSSDSLLTDDARAKILLIDVKPQYIDTRSYVELTEDEETSVSRVRALFYRELGRKKSFRDITGPTIDIPAFIQFRVDRKDPDIFEGEALNRGFAYHVVSDMSGSMSGVFPIVSHAMVMLKHALDFPFVRGEFWGFRGGTDVSWKGSQIKAGSEVWLYRYDKKCKGFTGNAPVIFSGGGRKNFPVACGGLTPMHAALRVAVKHMNRNVPSGMAKRLYLLTDGSPFHLATGGNLMSMGMLQKFVAKEIQWARSHGIEVNTIVIGDGIPDDEAALMFGNKKYWRRANKDNSIDKMLTALVLLNFSKYLKAR